MTGYFVNKSGINFEADPYLKKSSPTTRATVKINKPIIIELTVDFI